MIDIGIDPSNRRNGLTADLGKTIAEGYARGEKLAFCHSRPDEEYCLQRGLLTIMRCKGCVWEEWDRLYVESVTDGGTGLSIATRLPDEDCTPGPVITLPYAEATE